MKNSTKNVFAGTLGFLIGITSVIITLPYAVPLIHSFAHSAAEKVSKPLGGTIEPHPLAGTFEHEVKRTD